MLTSCAPQNSMNNRANILYFLEVLCDMSVAAQSVDYVRMIQRDILRVVDAVAPEDGSGAANIKVVRKVLQGLQNKGHLSKQTVDEIEECLRERDAALAVGGVGVGMSSPMEGVEGQGEGEVQIHGTGTRTGERDPATQQQQVLSRSQSRMSMAGKLDKKQVEQRIEEDRERHKRLRENQWATPSAAAGDDDAEFDQLYDETSSLASDDYRVFEEEALQREECAALQLEEMAALEAGKGAE
jgi:CTD kinase subunit gamma